MEYEVGRTFDRVFCELDRLKRGLCNSVKCCLGINPSGGSSSMFLNQAGNWEVPSSSTSCSAVNTCLGISGGGSASLFLNQQGSFVSASPSGAASAFGGSYTPVYTSGSGTGSITGTIAYYTKVGSIVTVYGTCNVTNTSFFPPLNLEISLPIPSSFVNTYDASGMFTNDTDSGASGQNIVGFATAVPSSSLVKLNSIIAIGSSGTSNWYYHFTYIIH